MARWDKETGPTIPDWFFGFDGDEKAAVRNVLRPKAGRYGAVFAGHLHREGAAAT